VVARLSDPNHRKITSASLLVNGRKVSARDLQVVPASGPPAEWTQSVPLTPGENILSVVAVNDAGAESAPASVRVVSRGGENAGERKPNLYVLAIGVSRYATPEFSLKYPAKDAEDLAGVYRAQQGKLFGNVVCKLLTDEHAGSGEILDGLDWLSKQVTQRDWALVFVSGHGLNDNLNQYYFAPYNVDPEHLKRTGVVWSEFRTTLANLPSKVLLLLDTCHAAGAGGERSKGSDAYNDILRDAATDEVGLIVFASCMPREQSLERDDWGHGAFTKAVLEALGGKADANGDGVVTLSEAEAYVADRVKELTDGRQHPTTQQPASIHSSLPLAILK